MATDKTADTLAKRFDKLHGQRQVWEGHWQEIADYCLPRKADITKRRHEGDKRAELIFDATAIHSVELLSASLHGMLTNASTAWFTLSFTDTALRGDDAAMEWLEAATERMYEAFHRSNFQQEIHELYYDLVTFGTGCIYVEEDEQKGLRFSTRHIAEIYLSENHRGIVDTIFRKYKMPARACADQFGMDHLPDKIKKAAEKDPFEMCDVIHVVQPRLDREVGKVGQANKAFASIHFDPDTKTILRESGFDEMPFMTPRYLKDSVSTYGRSPAMSALSDIKMLNKMSETSIRAAQKLIDPPLMVPDDGFMQPIRTRPGGLNYYRSGTRDRIEPLHTGSNIPVSINMEEQRRQAIRAAFYVDQLLLKEGPRMTATEVLQRNEEKMRLLGPVLGRLQAELLQPLINRSFLLMTRQNLFAPAPEFLQGMDIGIQYVSPLARAQKQTELQTIMRALEVMAQVGQIVPVMDFIDPAGLVDHLLDTLAVPAKVRKSDAEVEMARQERETAQAEAQEMQQTMALAKAAGQAAPALREVGNIGEQEAAAAE
jgi:hypothetical protein